MAENLRDTPATYEENLDYLRDPEHPKSKPYSSKQKAANAEHARHVTLYHKIHAPGLEGGRDFLREEVEAAKAEGWVTRPILHPNDPNVSTSRAAVVQPMTPERQILLEEAAKLGLQVKDTTPIDQLRADILDAASAPAKVEVGTEAPAKPAAKKVAPKTAGKAAGAG